MNLISSRRSSEPTIRRRLSRPLALLAAAPLALALSIAPSQVAGAATQSVTITANGYVPANSSVATGDSVTFVNGDVSAHQITFSAKNGVTCTPSPLVLQPTGTGRCTFSSPGKYSYSDPSVKGKTFSGTITVSNAPPSVSLSVSPGVARYGQAEHLSGTTSDQAAGQSIQAFAQGCNSTSSVSVGNAVTTAGGAFSFQVQPMTNTMYSVKAKGAASNNVLAGVMPRLVLAKTSLHHFYLRASAGTSLAGKYVTFQRFNTSLKRWVNVRTVTLRATSSGVAPTVVSSARFTSSVARIQKVRTVLGQVQAGACYSASISNVIFN